MAFSDIQSEVNANVETSQHTQWSATLTKRWINRALRWICEGQIVLPDTRMTLGIRTYSHDFAWLLNEVTADTGDEQRAYALPIGDGDTIWTAADATQEVLPYRKVLNIELINSDDARVKLAKYFKKDIEDDSMFSDTTDTGIPSHVVFEAARLLLYELPDHGQNEDEAWTINMEHYGYLEDMSADADTNYVTTNYPQLLVYKASAYGFEWTKEKEAEKDFEDRAVKRMLEIITHDQSVALSGTERGMWPDAGARIGVS